MKIAPLSPHKVDSTRRDDAPVSDLALTGLAARLPETLRYAGVGVLNTGFALIVFAGLEQGLKHRVPYLLVLVMSHVVSVLEAFALQRYVVFRVRGNLFLDLARFESVYLGSFLVNLAALPLLVSVIGFPVIFAQALYLFVSAVATYVLHKKYSFRRQAPHGVG